MEKEQEQEHILCCIMPKTVTQQRHPKTNKMLLKDATVYSNLQITVCRKASGLKQTKEKNIIIIIEAFHKLFTYLYIWQTKSFPIARRQSFLEIPEAGVPYMRRRHDGVVSAESLPSR